MNTDLERRCHVRPANWNDRAMTLTPDEEHYLVHVLRAKHGDTVGVFDGQGREALARVEFRPSGAQPGRGSRGRRGESLVLNVLSIRRVEEPRLAITLVQALPKAGRMDWIVEKATELGVSAIVPLITERVVGGEAKIRDKERSERWQRIALGAARQCRTGWAPLVHPIRRLADLDEVFAAVDLLLVGALDSHARHLRCVLWELPAVPRRRLALLIGPEGDLTADELRELIRKGAVPVSFGPVVLRVETAAIYGVSALNYELSDPTLRPPAPDSP